ncbi:MAG: trypsin-like peptidase domain-containing protein, partial [Thermoleophilia bacterium]|nr:trypsin-like peptidase domain-containing protein [Thermoleophilia bacterium]
LVLLGIALAGLLSGCSLSEADSSSPPTSATASQPLGAAYSTAPSPTDTLESPGTTSSTSLQLQQTTTTTTTTVRHLTSGDAASVARKLRSSVVGITAIVSRSRTEIVEAIGTGVVYSASGLIITANHVITGETSTVAKRIWVTLPSGNTLTASVVGRDPSTDIAVLRVRARNLHPAVLRTDLGDVMPG